MIIVMGLGINGSAEQSPPLLAQPPRPSCQQHWASKQCAAPGPLTPWLCACLLLSHLLAPSDAQPSQLSAADVCTALLACACMGFLAVDALMCALAPFACTCVCVCVHASSACVLSYAWFPLHACVHTQVDVHFSMHAHRCMAFLGMAAFPACTQLSLSWTHVHTSVCLPVAVHTHMHSLPHHACTHMHCTLRGCTHACTFPARTHSISQTHFQAQIRTEHLLPCQVPRAGC